MVSGMKQLLQKQRICDQLKPLDGSERCAWKDLQQG